MTGSLPKLVAFDLDDTLAESKQPVTQEMGFLLARLLTETNVAILSGARFPQFQIQVLPALPDGARLECFHLFPTNAGQYHTYRSGQWHAAYDHSFTHEERQHILRALEDTMALIETPKEIWGERIEDRGAQITFSALGQHAPLSAKSIWDPDQKKRLLMREALLERLPDCAIGIGGKNSVDITRKGITKAYGIRELSKATSIPITEMLYVGDALFPGGNDMIVCETGIKTYKVENPTDTARLIETLLRA